IDVTIHNGHSLSESVIEEHRYLCQNEHSRHRSFTGYAANLLAGLIAYCWFPFKPTIKIVSAYGQAAKKISCFNDLGKLLSRTQVIIIRDYIAIILHYYHIYRLIFNLE